MRHTRRWSGYGLFSLLAGCNWWKAPTSGGPTTPSTSSFPGIVQRHTDHRPTLVALVRQGDPQAALVLVIGQLGNVDESTQLAALVSARLSASAPTIEVLPHAGGLTMVATVESVSSVRQLTARLDKAIRTSVSVEEVAHPNYGDHLSRLRQSMAYQIPAAERDLCRQETLSGNRSGAGVERVRQQAFSEDRARWGIVGTREVVEAVDSAIRELAPWPSAAPVVPSWPEQDQAVFIPARNHAPHINVVWRSPMARKAISAGRELRSSSSALREVIAALPTSMHLDRVASTPQMVGGCVGMSLSQDEQSIPATIDELIATARIIRGELQRLSQRPPNAELAMLAVVEQANPRKAAELAALLAMSNDAEARPDRFRVEIDVGSELATLNPTPEQQRALAEVSAPFPPPETLPLVHVVERGQGNLHALLASPCATWSESIKTVGATGLLLRMLASRHHEVQRVTVEPWITANGVGLLAHTPRLSAEETPGKQAARLGEALGRVLATLRLETNDLWLTRNELLARFGPGPRPALWGVLLALSPRYPGLVVPDGTFASIEAISFAELQGRRAELLRLPLRLAVIETDDTHQGDVMRQSLMRWLSVFRLKTGRCPVLAQAEALPAAESLIESKFPDPDDAAVTLAMTLPVQDPSDEAHAEFLVWLLNRPSGWLAQRVRAGGIVASVDARVVGGSQRRGLVVAIGATPSSIDAALASIRGLFQELGATIQPQLASISLAVAQARTADRVRRIDPRARLEDLWLSRARKDKLTETSFRDYLKRAFATSNMLLVRSQRAAPEPTIGEARGKH